MNTASSTSAAPRPLRPARGADTRTDQPQPPGPPRRWGGIPLLVAMRRDYLGFAQQLQARHGDVSRMRILREHVWDLASPEAVREVMVEQADKLIRWERGIEIFEQVFGQSVLVTEGATWQRQRRMLQPAFTPKRVAGYGELMAAAAEEVLASAVPAGAASAEVEMDTLFTRLAMDVIMRTLFSTGASAQTRRAGDAVQVLSEAAMKEMFWPVTAPDWLPLPGKAAKRQALRDLRGLIQHHIDARHAMPPAQAPQDDLLAMLLALRDPETGDALSPQEVFDQCMVSFQAGHETSATALLWWSRLMAAEPQALARAQAEVDAVLAGRRPTAEDLPALPWLTATLKEAMRMFPPVAAVMTRRATADLHLGGYTVPRGALLRITPWVLHRDARSFPQPDAFQPERFLPGAPPLPRGAWMAFGTGPRVCIGQHFAMLEMTLAAALLLQRYEMHLAADAPPCAPRMFVTLRPAEPVRLRLMRREASAQAERQA